jgi:hypothetical protein
MPGNQFVDDGWASQLDGRNTGEKRGSRFGDQFKSKAEELVAHIMANRERYLEAWVAETGLHPSECELVETQWNNGERAVHVRLRKNDATTQTLSGDALAAATALIKLWQDTDGGDPRYGDPGPKIAVAIDKLGQALKSAPRPSTDNTSALRAQLASRDSALDDLRDQLRAEGEVAMAWRRRAEVLEGRMEGVRRLVDGAK